MPKFIKKKVKSVQILNLSPKEGVRLKKMKELWENFLKNNNQGYQAPIILRFKLHISNYHLSLKLFFVFTFPSRKQSCLFQCKILTFN